MCVCVRACLCVYACLCVFMRGWSQPADRRVNAGPPPRPRRAVRSEWTGSGGASGAPCAVRLTRGEQAFTVRAPASPRAPLSPCPRCPPPTRCPACVPSTPAPLGPLRKICLWHDSRGPSPAWYVSRVVVGELPAGPGRSWLFPAECWLAADRQDGRVARELACLRRGLGFWKVGGTVSPCSTAGPRAGHGSWPCSSRPWLP